MPAFPPRPPSSTGRLAPAPGSPWVLFWMLLPHALALSIPTGDSQEVVPVWMGSREGQVCFSLAAFGREFVLHLEPDASFLAPGLKIQHIGRKEPTAEFLPEEEEEEDARLQRRCFYSGTVNSQPDSLVAVSLCQGIHGSFLVDGEKYVIQPQGQGSGELLLQVHQLQKQGWAKEVPEDIPEEAAQAEPSSSNSRAKRFTSQARYVETLLVADTSMLRFYGEDLTNHILTLMSVAAQIYKHPSLKNSINLVVVKVLLVEDEKAGPEVSDNGGLMLRNFCNWQQQFNPPSDRHSEHYDTAILLTRQDFCGHQSCSTLGVAETGTMCDPNKSCSVIEDEGLQAAYTLAHELGHVLSMPHDDSKTCERLFGSLGRHHMMAPLFIHLNKTLPWSPCSAMYITEFLDGGHGDCLLDEPAEPIAFPTDLPGQVALYNLDRQCQQIFGKEFQHCPNASQEDICSQLWCKLDAGERLCHTKNGSLPWADGTPCGAGKMCLDGHCVAQDAVIPKPPVDGNWGPWSSWGPCSRTCGGGVHFSYRACDNPVPKNGGKYCEGQRVQYQSCNTEECPPNDKSFREQQCEKYNRYNYTDMNGNLLEWAPKYAGVSPRDRCKLVCQAKKGNEFKVFETKVIDGTVCAPDTLSVCVHGQCIKAGCDHIIGSLKKLDKCGVCGGNGSSCRKITGSLNRSKFGYNDIVTIPVGATNIDIKQHSRRGVRHDGNYLALRTLDGKYLLNGNLTVSAMEQDIFMKGTVLRYSGSLTTLERLQSYQRLPESITVQVLSVSSEMFLPKVFPSPKVRYTFFIPKDTYFSKQKSKEKSLANVIKPMLTSQWVLGDWSECSKSCGSGWQRRTVECLDVDGQSSLTCDKGLKPEDIKPCSDLPCPIWQMGPWSPCSQTCGEGVRTRSALCTDYVGKPIASEKCSSPRPPPATSPCMLQEC
uniref:A disintegrin and metalloproteinase with thrombospondin motifs 1 n=1 Tax=Anolis carolinensis TaxID=28377 RepID=H9GPK1_ANOCA|nr:PREDICTED: A disintegrin and metalloproteinase with thrombospondin motifs 8 [Anolis carolinensis]|eukprot:XP_003223216.1 PREDICTED: A disintegrin and metalloproteinase with thrombospondin motifs 8 [Anolis carolinensis]